MLRVAVFSSTSGSDLPALFSLPKEEFEFVLLTNKENCLAREKANAYQVKNIFINPEGKTREEYDKECLSALEKYSVDVILLVGYMRIVSDGFVEAYRDRIVNIHPSLLPAFAGGMDKSVHEEVINAGCKVTGATLHMVNEEVDGGDIIDQQSCRIEDGETPDSLKIKVQKLEQDMLVSFLKNYK